MSRQQDFWNIVHDARARSFKWGEHDCVTFAMRCVIALTGNTSIEKRVRELFGEWSDAQSALRAHRANLRGAISDILGESVAWTRLTLGSVALILDDEGREVVAVHDGVQLLVPVAIGLKAVTPDRALCGWRLQA